MLANLKTSYKHILFRHWSVPFRTRSVWCQREMCFHLRCSLRSVALIFLRPSVNNIVSTTSLCQYQVDEFQKRLSVTPEAQVRSISELETTKCMGRACKQLILFQSAGSFCSQCHTVHFVHVRKEGIHRNPSANDCSAIQCRMLINEVERLHSESSG